MLCVRDDKITFGGNFELSARDGTSILTEKNPFHIRSNFYLQMMLMFTSDGVSRGAGKAPVTSINNTRH
jgi:hypothetical protein